MLVRALLVKARYKWALPLVVSRPVPISTNVSPVAEGTAVWLLPEVWVWQSTRELAAMLTVVRV